MNRESTVCFNQRGSGILLHPVSLPGSWGIGRMGKEAYDFTDKLVQAGISYWQMLPLSPVGFGNSPYQSWSAFAGNSLLISPHLLQNDGFLPSSVSLETLFRSRESGKVDYRYASKATDFFLKLAFETYRKSKILSVEFDHFYGHEHWWLDDHSVFSAIRKSLGNLPLQKWPPELRKRNPEVLAKVKEDLKDAIDFEKFKQFLFYRYWFVLKDYANSCGLRLVGDLPIYVSADSVEVWTQPSLFEVDRNLNPVFVSGVPPDYFSETGQLWGNPVYRWKTHIRTGFQWWHKRFEFSRKMFDAVRIDHFRGFSEYWSVCAGEITAEKGEWRKAPGKKLFKSHAEKYVSMPVIAEDLGILSDEAVALRKYFGYPGMKVLQFAFVNPEENDFLPHRFDSNFVVYTGTHDNNTTRGWFDEDATEEEKKFVMEYLNCPKKDVVDSLIRLAWSSVANTAIVPAQDILNLPSGARMNTPGTTKNNWNWRMTGKQLENFPSEQLGMLNSVFSR